MRAEFPCISEDYREYLLENYEDTYLVQAAKDKLLRSENRVVVEGINMIKKHVKPNGQTAGSIVEMEAPIHASNVMMLDPKSKKRTRIGHTTDKKGNKVRIAKKSGEILD